VVSMLYSAPRKELVMVAIQKFISFLVGVIIVCLPVSAVASQPSAGDDRRSATDVRVLQPVNIAILIQDDLVSHVSNELDLTREFIKSLPAGSQVMVGYIGAGSLQVRQPFTKDLGKAARSLRIITSSASAAPYNPYVEVLEALKKFNAKSLTPNVVLLISDGLDTSRGFDSASVLDSIDMRRAIKEAKRRNVAIYSFFAPTVALSSRSFRAASLGQSALNRISHDTGGEAFFQGTTDFVTFNPHFERLARALNQLEAVRR
jgi:hypothetical protein